MAAEVTFDQSAFIELLHDPGVRDALLAAANERIPLAQARAPKLTGRGAASIHAEAVLDGESWAVHVSWDRERYYMKFHEEGDRYMPPRPFLGPAFA